ncbi:MAG: peptide chain release factor N(5)-glutamine methyltransferase [bacterium]
MPNQIASEIKNTLLTCKYYHASNASQDAWYLLQKLTGKNKAQLLTETIINLTPTQKRTLSKWLKLITKDNKPIQYILGSIPFCNVEILLKPPILIPRPETEYICDWIINKLKKINLQNLQILDLCSGTGCIGLAIAKEFKNYQITCTDINPKAISLIKKNAIHNKIKNVIIIKSDLFEKLKNKKYDIIISNPPYISEKEWQNLDKNITLWEDKNALVANQNGLFIIKKIIKNAPFHIKNNDYLLKNKTPQIILEIGQDQGKEIIKIIQSEKTLIAKICKDLQKNDRWVAISSKKSFF